MGLIGLIRHCDMSSSAGSTLRQFRSSWSTYLRAANEAFDTGVQRVNGCLLGSTPFDYPTSTGPAAGEHSTCCSRACWVYCLHYLAAFILDLLGCLPFDPALDRLASFLCLWVGLAIFEEEPGWTNLFSKGWLVTSGAGYGASCFKAWRDRSKKREEIAHKQQQQQQPQPASPTTELQPQQVRRQHVMNVRAVEEQQQQEDEEQPLLAQPTTAPSVIRPLRSLVLHSSPEQLPSMNDGLAIVERELAAVVSDGRLALTCCRDLTQDNALNALWRAYPSHVLLLLLHCTRVLDEAGEVVHDWFFSVLPSPHSQYHTPCSLAARLLCKTLLMYNERHHSEPIQCVIMPYRREIVAELLAAVDFVVMLDIREVQQFAWFAAEFHTALLDRLRIDRAVQRAAAHLELVAQEPVQDLVHLFSAAPDIVRPLFGDGSQKNPHRIEHRTQNEVQL